MSKYIKRKSARSGTKPCDLCGKKRKLVRHHIGGRDIPNAESDWNTCWLCPDEHDDIHAGDLIVENWVQTTEGRKLAWHRKNDLPQYTEGIQAPLYTQKS